MEKILYAVTWVALQICGMYLSRNSSIDIVQEIKKLYPDHRRHEIENCSSKAAKFIEDIQALGLF